MSTIFPGDLPAAARTIRALYPTLAYDHRPQLSANEPDFDWKQTESFRLGYACFKNAVATVLQPDSICEIGVGGGVAAMAFLQACPAAKYVGIDNGEYGRIAGFDFLEDVSVKCQALGYNVQIERSDSRNLSALPAPGAFDLIHIDGCHQFSAARHDMRLAWKSGSRWILVDDGRDSQVAAAVWSVVYELQSGPTSWAYFEDTWTGSILFCRELDRP